MGLEWDVWLSPGLWGTGRLLPRLAEHPREGVPSLRTLGSSPLGRRENAGPAVA